MHGAVPLACAFYWVGCMPCSQRSSSPVLQETCTAAFLLLWGSTGQHQHCCACTCDSCVSNWYLPFTCMTHTYTEAPVLLRCRQAGWLVLLAEKQLHRGHHCIMSYDALFKCVCCALEVFELSHLSGVSASFLSRSELAAAAPGVMCSCIHSALPCRIDNIRFKKSFRAQYRRRRGL